MMEQYTSPLGKKNIAWHAGNRKYNLYAIGIELEGYTYKGDFTDAEYKAAAKLVAYLCKKYNVPIYHPDGVAPADPTQGKGIIGHIQVQTPITRVSVVVPVTTPTQDHTSTGITS